MPIRSRSPRQSHGREPPRGPGDCRPQRLGGGSTKPLTISGITLNSVGVPLPLCTVHLFLTATDVEVAETISDYLGRYSFDISPADSYKAFYCVAYRAGSPDVAGTTVNTLAAS